MCLCVVILTKSSLHFVTSSDLVYELSLKCTHIRIQLITHIHRHRGREGGRWGEDRRGKMEGEGDIERERGRYREGGGRYREGGGR